MGADEWQGPWARREEKGGRGGPGGGNKESMRSTAVNTRSHNHPQCPPRTRQNRRAFLLLCCSQARLWIRDSSIFSMLHSPRCSSSFSYSRLQLLATPTYSPSCLSSWLSGQASNGGWALVYSTSIIYHNIIHINRFVHELKSSKAEGSGDEKKDQ